MVLGAAVGFGFAALESSGYALASFYPIGGRRFTHALDNVLLTELARGVLAPFGHGMWTAVVAGVIFVAVAHRKWLLGAVAIVAAYLLVSGLHGAFDSIDGVKGYIIISLIGLVPLVWMWHRGRPLTPAAQPSGELTATVGTSAG